MPISELDSASFLGSLFPLKLGVHYYQKTVSQGLALKARQD